jgi:uncharacterized protein (DUF2384 family)
MSQAAIQLFDNVARQDHLHFASSSGGVDYKRVAAFLDFDKQDLSRIANVQQASVRFDEKIPGDLAQRLKEIANILNLVAEVFEGDGDKTALWFKTPNFHLGEISPRDMIRAGRYKRLLKFIQEARED